MRLITITLTVLAAATFAAVVKADDVPKRSPELQVLDRFVGTWDVHVAIKPVDGEKITFDHVSERAWSLGGTFVRLEDANNLRRTGEKEFQLLWTYDPEAKNYPAVFMDGPNRGELTGTWDEKTTTMHWKGKSPDGSTSEGKHRFIGKDRAEPSGVFKDADGKVVMEISWPQTRRTATAKAADATASAPDRIGFIQRLPKDGTWAEYSANAKVGENDLSGKATARMVGTTTEDGQKCRWIEFHAVVKKDGKDISRLAKFLFREKDFADGVTTIPKVLRGWEKVDDNDVIKMTDSDILEWAGICGWMKDAKTVELEKVIDYQKDQLRIATARRGKVDGPPEVDITLTIWSHEKSPFGTAVMQTSMKAGDAPVIESEMTLKDQGTGSKSALPDHN